MVAELFLKKKYILMEGNSPFRRAHVCLLGLVFLGVCSADWLRLGQLTSSGLV